MGLVFMIWLAGITASLSIALIFIGVVCGVIAFGIFGIRYVSWADSSHAKAENKPKFTFTGKIMIWSIAAILIGTLIPDQKTTYYMAGAYVGVKAVQSETANKVVQMVNIKIDEYLNEMTAKVEKTTETAKEKK